MWLERSRRVMAHCLLVLQLSQQDAEYQRVRATFLQRRTLCVPDRRVRASRKLASKWDSYREPSVCFLVADLIYYDPCCYPSHPTSCAPPTLFPVLAVFFPIQPCDSDHWRLDTFCRIHMFGSNERRRGNNWTISQLNQKIRHKGHLLHILGSMTNDLHKITSRSRLRIMYTTTQKPMLPSHPSDQ
jgi:hypothetical protein